MAGYGAVVDQPLIAFLTKVFVRNPERIASWLESLKDLGEAQQRSIWIAAWSSGVQGVDALLRARAVATSQRAMQFVGALLRQRMHFIEDVPLASAIVLDMQWAAFFATGDERFIVRVVEALGLVASPEGSPAFAVGTSALWSLRSNAKRHPKVLEVCREVLPEVKSDGMRMMLESIISDTCTA